MSAQSSTPAPVLAIQADKDQQLLDDTRLLGQILGETVREQDGETAYELIEAIRRLSVAFQRNADAQAGRDLDTLLKRLSPNETVSVIRAFSFFSHLANLAEDRHHVRRRAVHEAQEEDHQGSLASSIATLSAAGIDADRIARTLSSAYVSPVLTAHPTEVQRKSILDAERAIADLLTAARHAAQRAPAPRQREPSSAPASRSSGRPACSAIPSSPCSTRSRTC